MKDRSEDPSYHERTLLPRSYKQIMKEGKEMFYLTTHSTHFIYGYTVSEQIMTSEHSKDHKELTPSAGLATGGDGHAPGVLGGGGRRRRHLLTRLGNRVLVPYSWVSVLDKHLQKHKVYRP